MTAVSSELTRDQELIQAAAAKRRADPSYQPNSAERNAIRRERERETLARMRALPPKLFEQITGLPAKVRIEWEERHGIPCGRGRETIDLLEVFVAIRQLFKANRFALSGSDEGGDIDGLRRDKVAGQVRNLELKNEGLMLTMEEMKRVLVPIDQIAERMDRMANLLRELGDTFARKTNITGAEAQAMVNQKIAQFERELERVE